MLRTDGIVSIKRNDSFFDVLYYLDECHKIIKVKILRGLLLNTKALI